MVREAGQPSKQLWDAGVRIFHWLLAICFLVSWQTASPDTFLIHKISGYTILSLLLFRIGWGMWGGETARFAQFVKGPRAILGYARNLGKRQPSHWQGHNPVGALAVLALILLLLAQVGSGLFSSDVDVLMEGPLASHISFEASRAAAGAHEAIFNIALLVVILHIAAVLFYLAWKRENLIGPMVTGRSTAPGASARAGSPLLLVLTALGAVALVALLVNFA